MLKADASAAMNHIIARLSVSVILVAPCANLGCTVTHLRVDIGIKENGLVHISQMADRYISNPTEIVSMHQPLKVRVIGIDRERKRIQLSLKDVS